MNRRGTTLAEVLIVLSVIGAACVGAAFAFRKCFAVDYSVVEVEKEARRWATGMGISVTNVSCSSHAEDGYIPCTVSDVAGEHTELIAIECAAPLTPEKGCRIQRAAVPGPHR